LPAPWGYRVGLTVLDAACVGLLISFVNRPAGRVALSRATAWTALTSYSVYLTHSLALHVAVAVMRRVPSLPAAAYFPLALLAIGVSGWLFWRAFEVTSIDLRERLARRRESSFATASALEG
jgi:peptidoglycan/LPS O-acetylase OafA/YrhL